MSNGYGNRPGLGTGMAEKAAQEIEKSGARRRRRTGGAMAAARAARGYKPGEGSKMAERLRKKGQ